MEAESLKGKRGIAIGRVSSQEQAKAPSIDKQLDAIREFTESVEMTIVEEIRLEAFSATLNHHESVLRSLIQRKVDRNDFDHLVFMNYDRFLRDISVGRDLFQAANRVGVYILSTMEPMPTGELWFIWEDMILYKSESFVREIAKHTSTGYLKAVKDGRIPPVNNINYAVDKLIVSPEGENLYIFRDLPDRKVKLNAETLVLIDSIPKRKHERTPIKRKLDWIVPVPGNDIEANIVRKIFKLKFLEQKTPRSIAKELNLHGVPSPHGGYWQAGSVRSLLLNSIYTGKSIGGRKTTGSFVVRNPKKFKLHDRKKTKPTGKKYMPPVYLPMADWIVVDVPTMSEFLPSETRETAKAWQWEQYALKEKRRNDATTLNVAGRLSGGNRHRSSLFPLSGIMHSVQDGLKMVGVSVGHRKNGHRVRTAYYMVRAFKEYPLPWSVFRKGINAKAVESSVVETLTEVLSSFEGLVERIKAGVSEATEQQLKDRLDMKAIDLRREELEQQYHALSRDLGPRGRAIMKEAADKLELQLASLEERKAAALATLSASPEDAQQIAGMVQSQCGSLVGLIKEQKIESFHSVFKVFVKSCLADLATKEVFVEFALPSWSITTTPDVLLKSSMVEASGNRDIHQTSPANPILLAKFKLSFHSERIRGNGSKVWYTSERLQV